MPELPDVEAVIKRVKKALVGRRIEGVSVRDRRLVSAPLLRPVVGKKVLKIMRRGKFIVICLDGGLSIIIHLRMTGDLVIVSRGGEADGYTRLILRFDGRELRFLDRRRLGVVFLYKGPDPFCAPGLSRLGVEPLGAEFTLEVLKRMLNKSRASVKSFLLNQRNIAGIGNIYGDEILFQSGIRPDKRACDLNDTEVSRLFRTIRRVLSTACRRNADLSGLRTWFVHSMRAGICARCLSRLERKRIQGRYSCYCPVCQR